MKMVVFVLVCILCFPRFFAEKELYLRFDSSSAQMSKYQNNSVTYYRFKIIDKGESYRDAVKNYTDKILPDNGNKIAAKDNYLLFTTRGEVQNDTLSLNQVEEAKLKDITWLRRYYFNYFYILKRGKATHIFEMNRDFESIYIVEIDSAADKAVITKVKYNLPPSY